MFFEIAVVSLTVFLEVTLVTNFSENDTHVKPERVEIESKTHFPVIFFGFFCTGAFFAGAFFDLVLAFFEMAFPFFETVWVS